MTSARDPGDRLPIGGSAIQGRLADAAVDLFYARGAASTTVRDITAACGLTPGALYNHFSSKDDLLYLLVRDIHQQVADELGAVVAEAGEDPSAQLAAAVRFLVAHTAGHKKRSRVALREYAALTDGRRREVRAIRRQLRDQVAAIVAAGARKGVFAVAGGDDEAAAAHTASTITTICVHASDWTLGAFPLSPAQLQDRYAELALRLVGAA